MQKNNNKNHGRPLGAFFPEQKTDRKKVIKTKTGQKKFSFLINIRKIL